MNDEGCPETLDEVVDKTLEYLPDDVKIEIAQMNEDDLILLHFGLGMWIRNQIRGWRHNEKLAQALQDKFSGRIELDSMSRRIIKKVWRRLRRSRLTKLPESGLQ